MNIIHSYRDEWFGILPQMVMNILSLLEDGDVLEIEGYNGGDLDMISCPFPTDTHLGHSTLNRTYKDDYGVVRNCNRPLYISGYTDEWMDELEEWINQRWNLDSLNSGHEDENDLQTWMFIFTRDGDDIIFRDEVLG